MALTNYEKQKRWREKNRALYNFQQRQRRKNFGGSEKQPCKHGLEEAKDGLNRAIVQPDNAPPATRSSNPTIEALREMVERVSSESDVPVVKSQVFKNDYGAIISESAYNRLQKMKEKAKDGDYVIDDYSQ